ncbi:MAG TPA: RDD family protein [Thermoanaerobaculia bacterium]|nr:RDD family protein [Thermoanaerobaculia bacterium]
MEVASLNLSANAVPSTPYAQSGLVAVGFGRRLAARIIDTIIHFGVGLFGGVFSVILIGIYSAVSGASSDALLARVQGGGAAGFLLSLLGSILYDSISEGLHGSTAGKLLLGMVVLREDGRPCTYVQAVGRSLAFFFDSLFFGLVAHSSMKDSPMQQRYGDKWAGTIVVQRSSAPQWALRGGLRFVGVFFLALFVDAVALITGLFA